MTSQAQEILRAARALPPHEQLELLEGLAQSLAETFSPLGQATAAFWAHRSLEEMALETRTPPMADLSTLVVPDWPRDETADDLITYIHERHRADRDR